MTSIALVAAYKESDELRIVAIDSPATKPGVYNYSVEGVVVIIRSSSISSPHQLSSTSCCD